MGIILDIIILLVFALFIFKCYRQPQLRGGLETLAYLASIILAVPGANFLSDIIYSKLFRKAISHSLERVVLEAQKISMSNTSNIQSVVDCMPNSVQNALDSYQVLSEERIAEVDSLIQSNSYDAPQRIADLIAQPVITGIFRAVLCALLFCGLLYLLKSLAAVFENAFYTPEREAQNTVLCGVYGCFKALIVITLSVSVIQLLLPALPHMRIMFSDLLSNSFLFKLFYHQNILMLFLGKGIYPMTM